MREEIEQYRKEIDELDQQLRLLYKKRLNVSRKVGAYKKKQQLAILDAERESAIKMNLANQYMQDEDFLAYMYLHDAMMLVSRNAQYIYPPQSIFTEGNHVDCLRVGYQGAKGSFSFIASKRVFPKSQVQAYETFEAVFEAVRMGEVAFGVLPLENSIHGEVVQVFDLLCDGSVYIVDEVIQPIEHCLLAVEGATVDMIREVHSHPQALAQTAAYLKQLPNIQQIASLNTATSAKLISEKKDKAIAAIASKAAALEYGLMILDEHIETFANNQTRFIVIAKALTVKEHAEKTSIILTTNHQSGSLAQVVAQFQYEHINMLKITSRPIPNQPWKYQFFIDFEGSLRSECVQRLLKRLQTEVLELTLLGSYPCALIAGK